MTQLFIDSKEVKLPSEFELELVTENPYFNQTLARIPMILK